MNRRRGTALGALLLAVVGISYLPRWDRSNPAPETGNQTQRGASIRTAKKEATLSPPVRKFAPGCEQIADQLKRFYSADMPVPDSCLIQDARITSPPPSLPTPNVHFVIAFVSDPVQTHLPLSFDRYIEAIQQAAQDANYVYDGSWFPWEQTQKSYGSLSDEEAAEEEANKQQEQPGIVIFRRGLEEKPVSNIYSACEKDIDSKDLGSACRAALDSNSENGKFYDSYREGLIIFVVGEQPTGGISDTELVNALSWMRVLGTDHSNKSLRILGPGFSGSLPSLARRLNATNAFELFDQITINSGSASSETSVRWFKEFLVRQRELAKPGTSQKEFNFRSFYESDSLITDRFLCYLQHQDYDISKVAILSEDETAFGQQPSPKDQDKAPSPVTAGCDLESSNQRPIYLYYPRDIATLRSAYEKQSIFTTGRQQANAPSTTLRGDLSEPDSREHDTVRTYAGQLTPLEQEAVLFGITNVLDSKHIEFVILRSSNSLDQLFLSEFLRRSYPSGRVVIDGSDLLFRRGMQGASLRGVLLLSPYPLLSWTQDSIPKLNGRSSKSYRVFGLDSSEAFYIAARDLLYQINSTRSSVAVGDYGPPGWTVKGVDENQLRDDDKRPATWITVVGHRQFWPVAVLNARTQPYGPDHVKSLLKPEGPQDDPPSQSGVPLPGEMVGLLAFCLMLAVWHLYCCWQGSIIGSPHIRAHFAPMPRMEHLALVFIGSLTIGYVGMLPGLSLLRNVEVFASMTRAALPLIICAIVLLGFLACLGSYSLQFLSPGPSKHESNRIEQWRRRSLLVWPLSLAVLVLLHWYFLNSRLDPSNARPAFWRSMYLRSGVSPLLPQLLLAFGIYAWFWFSLQGLSLFGADRPVLPRKNALPKLDVPDDCEKTSEKQIDIFRMFSQEDAGDYIEAAGRPFNSSYLKSLGIFIPVTVIICWLALGEFGLRTLGDRHFGTWIFLSVCLCIAMILAEALQFLRTWGRLRLLLSFLDRLRLRRTLAALKGISWESVWKMSGNVLGQRYRLISRQFESMRNLQNLLNAWTPVDATEIQAKNNALECLKDCAATGLCFAAWYTKICDPKHPLATDLTRIRQFQEALAATAGCVMEHLIRPAWNKETQSLILGLGTSGDTDREKDEQGIEDKAADAVKPKQLLSAAEEFFVLPYLGFIQNTIGRLRSIVFSIIALFVAATFAVSSYPFDPLPVIATIFLVLFVLVGATVVVVYAEMHRDATLSHLTNTRPGELGFDFWTRIFTFGIGPLIGLLTTLFPSIADFVVSFLQPGTQAIK